MMAFARPGPEGYHPAPWKAARGGFGYDIEVEIRVPVGARFGQAFDEKETIWWIAALIRLLRFPHLAVPVISDQSFNDIPTSRSEPALTPFETERRIVSHGQATVPVLEGGNLDWIAAKWRPTLDLMAKNPRFYSAVKAFDSSTVQGRASASMLALWGAIEQLFSPSPTELRYRVAALLSSYLEDPGEERWELYRQILKLYNERSLAAHTAREVEIEPLIQTYVIMRNALVRMIRLQQVPDASELESLLFCVTSSRARS